MLRVPAGMYFMFLPGTISNRYRPASSGLAVSSFTWLPLSEMQPCNDKKKKFF